MMADVAGLVIGVYPTPFAAAAQATATLLGVR
jgi:hypothetical protein